MGSAGAGFHAGCAAGGSAIEWNPARDAELHAAMGQIDRCGGEGDLCGFTRGGEPDGGGESVVEAERRTGAEGGGFRAAARLTCGR